MTNWLRKKLRNFLNDDIIKQSRVEMISTSEEISEDNTLRFQVTPARGGIIVSVKNYNRRKDTSENTVHVIHDDEDVAQRVAEIVSMSLLRN